ncbi:MAG: hypothetical protein LCH61_19235 [Proteobacteria bacterium]|nr:hypothetical protein [Pseudomonadota bacterium]
MQPIASDIDVVNAALARIGGGDIMALDEDTELAGVCARIYPVVRDRVLSHHDFQHLRATRKLERVAAELTPPNGYPYAFQRPVEAVSPVRRLLTDPKNPDSLVRDFIIEGALVCCSVTEVWGIYNVMLTPDQWMPDLRDALIVALAADLTVAVCEDKDLAALLHQQAWGSPAMQGRGGLMAKAVASDHAQGQARRPAQASFGGGGNWWGVSA